MTFIPKFAITVSIVTLILSVMSIALFILASHIYYKRHRRFIDMMSPHLIDNHPWCIVIIIILVLCIIFCFSEFISITEAKLTNKRAEIEVYQIYTEAGKILATADPIGCATYIQTYNEKLAHIQSLYNDPQYSWNFTNNYDWNNIPIIEGG